MAKKGVNSFGAETTFDTGTGKARLYRLAQLEDDGIVEMARLPYAVRVLLESLLRNENGFDVTEEDIRNLAAWSPSNLRRTEVPFKPARVILQDFTGVPSLVDLAAMRSALDRLGADPSLINPQVPVELVIDHSVQVDRFGVHEALQLNSEYEFRRNRERYEFLHWGQNAFEDLRVVPPATGIVHQVNLEYLAPVVALREEAGGLVAFPDSLVGTDSHTPMINGLGVLGWGVGGIEAEAAMLGEPVSILTPEVVGFELSGELAEGATATDMVLMVTEMLRKRGVVGKFVEFYGDGIRTMSVPDRATLSNMAPEQGATISYFPVDERTLEYLRFTGRSPGQVKLVERYTKAQGLFRTDEAPDPEFTDTLSLDLGSVEPSLAGPKRPHDRVGLSQMKGAFARSLTAPIAEQGFALDSNALGRTAEVAYNGERYALGHGAVVIAAITSCTNTSNPSVMIAAGLVAKKAVEAGLRVPLYVKTSLAPGSGVVTAYLNESGLTEYLEQLGFYLVGYGCTTCIGNSGPLPPEVAEAIVSGDLVAAAVLSGNRNFEGRIHNQVQASYLASPPLVVAYALAGSTTVDLTREPLGKGKGGHPVYLRDIWPTQAEVREAMDAAVTADQFRKRYASVFTGNETWNAIGGTEEAIYPWDPKSTYIKEPPFFQDLAPEPGPIHEIHGARVLVLLGDSVTTDHISPAGAFPAESPAGRYLIDKGVDPKDFNSYGSRRGNDRVMTRGTFANVRLKNLLLPGTEGGVTIHLPSGQEMSVFEAANRYREEGTPLLVLAGKEYGTGSSRDWAAKGSLLLGVKAVIAEGYERIHRSNLIGMGVLPLQFREGEGVEALGLTGHELFDVEGLNDKLQPGQELTVRVVEEDQIKSFRVNVRIDSPVEVNTYRNGGILQTVLRNLLRESGK
ncbi:MAG: aconitate hydratase AcnA [Candidatus Thermoplasmatota archaeon]|nr:aconitate hydratase AcnA [Candidatus Thermoplasmatota archaeon]